MLLLELAELELLRSQSKGAKNYSYFTIVQEANFKAESTGLKIPAPQLRQELKSGIFERSRSQISMSPDAHAI